MKHLLVGNQTKNIWEMANINIFAIKIPSMGIHVREKVCLDVNIAKYTINKIINKIICYPNSHALIRIFVNTN